MMENNPGQEESSTHEESRLDQEQDQEITFIPSHVQLVFSRHVHASYRGSQDGLYYQCWSLQQIFEMALEMQKHS